MKTLARKVFEIQNAIFDAYYRPRWKQDEIEGILLRAYEEGRQVGQAEAREELQCRVYRNIGPATDDPEPEESAEAIKWRKWQRKNALGF